ncbi:MAG: site-specific integrase [Erysipelotrichaceae bacterium]|nr:site-specific integrase [Erysipelotrichaceae bacterium]
MLQVETKFSQASQEWLKLKKISIKPSSYDKYVVVLNHHLYRLFIDKDIDQWTDSDFCDLFIKFKTEDKLSNSTLNTIRTVLKGCLEYAEYKYNIKHIDLSRISIPHSDTKVEIFTQPETDLLAAYCEANLNHKTLPIYISLYTGLRLGEVCGLTWNDIDLNEGIIYVRRTVERVKVYDIEGVKTQLMILDPKTKSSKREVPMTDFLIEYVRAYKQFSDGQQADYIITNKSDVPAEPRTVERRYERICKILEISNLTYHALRHTFATKCIACGMDPKILSEILGHSDTYITLNIYVHPTREIKRAQIRKIQK